MTDSESSMHHQERQRAQRLVTELRAGALTRREFARRAALLGFSGAAINLLLMACSVGPFGQAAPTPTTPATPAASAPPSSAAPSAAASGSAPASAAATPTRPGATPGAVATPATPTVTPTLGPAASPIATPRGALLNGPIAPNAPLADRQVLNYPSQEPNSADPGLMTALGEVQLAVACWDGLVALDRGGEPQPAHATKYEVAPDGLKWTFTLRDGLKWSDGGALTAADYEWTWKRNLSPELASQYAQFFFPIKGAQDYNSGKVADRNGVGVRAVNATTLEVTLAAPAPHFLALVSTWPYFPLQRATIEKNGEKWTEPGTIVTAGRFKVQSWDHERQIVLARDPNYYGEKPPLEQITFKLYKNLATEALAAFERGDVDIAPVLQPADLGRARQDPRLRAQLSLLPTSGTGFLVFDTGNARSPVAKKEFRQAVYQAFNRDKLCNTTLQGQFAPTATLLPPGILGHLDQPPTPVNLRGDAARARQLLQAAGYSGQEIVLTHSTQGRAAAVATALGQDLRDAGIAVRLEALEARAYAAWRQGRAGQPFDLYVGSWFSDYEDPANWYGRFFADPADDYWHSRFAQTPNGARLTQLLADAGKAQDRKQRGDLFTQIERLVLDELPLAPIYGFMDAVLVRPSVKGLVHTATGLDLFGDVRVLKQ